MDENKARTIIKKIDDIIKEHDDCDEDLPYDYDCFGDITLIEIVWIAKQLMSDYGFNESDYYMSSHSDVWNII